MQNFLAYLFLSLALILPATLSGIMLRRWFPQWWCLRLVRGAMLVFVLACVALFLLILAAAYLDFDPSRTILGLAMILVWLPQAALMFTLPLAALWLGSGRRLLQRLEENPPSTLDLRRRSFLQATGALLPLTVVSTSVAGVAGTMGGARSFIVKVTLPGLPPALRGLRVLQLSDVHLGGFMLTDFLAQTLENARTAKPDLIVVTGDLADDYRLLPEALTMLEDFGAPLGVFAIQGNHEYGNGIEQFQKLVADSSVQLLVNESRRINVRGASLYLAGVDDITGRPNGTDRDDYTQVCVAAALQDRQSSDFSILLSHRPDSFDLAAQHQVPLTLAGHTHGGQAALAGKSWLELAGVEKYAWGLYRKGDSVLYTTAGAGQWAPVRVGCPTEAPVFDLG